MLFNGKAEGQKSINLLKLFYVDLMIIIHQYSTGKYSALIMLLIVMLGSFMIRQFGQVPHKRTEIGNVLICWA